MTHLPDFKRDLLAAGADWHSPRARLRRGAAVATLLLLVTAVVGGAVLALPGDDAREVPADPRPPAFEPGENTVQHVRVVVENAEIRNGRRKPMGGVEEEWLYRGEARRITSYTGSRRLEHVIGADGVMSQVDGAGGARTVRPTDNADSRRVIAEERRGFVAEFFRKYERAEPDPARDLTFRGRPARRAIYRQVIKAFDQDGNELDRSLGPPQAYYVDRDTGAPLGITGREHFGNITMVYRRSFTVVEELPPTAENLAKVREHELPRPPSAPIP